jgi:hypothetical protein
MIITDQLLLTVSELAAKLKVKEAWIYGETRKTGRGTISRIRVGNYLRFSLQEVMAAHLMKDRNPEAPRRTRKCSFWRKW